MTHVQPFFNFEKHNSTYVLIFKGITP